MQIFHIAEKPRWDAALLAGSYAQSTRGRTLEEEGFIHAARGEQWLDVLDRYYSDATEPLVLLTIDTDLLTSPWQEEQVGDETFPHIHGPLNPSAVIAVRPIPGHGGEPERSAPAAPPAGPPRTLMQEFLGEFSFRIITAVGVMVLAAVCGFGAIALFDEDKAGLPGLAVGAAVGIAVVVWLSRRRTRRINSR